MSGEQEGLRFFRNRLPQWRLPEGIYFVTWCLHEEDDELTPEERSIEADAIRHFNQSRYDLAIFVVMDDHVHLVLQVRPNITLGKVLQGLKGFTARVINELRGKRGELWQKDSHTELLAGQQAIEGCLQYIWDNPRERWGIPSEEYPWLEQFN